MAPSKNPSSEPTNTQYTVILQPVKFDLFFTGRRLNSRTLEVINENTLRETLRSVITDCMEENFSSEGFHSVQMVLNELESNSKKSSYKIGGSMVFDTIHVTNIPDDRDILDKMLMSLASADTKTRLGGNIVDISASRFSNSSVKSVQNAKENDTAKAAEAGRQATVITRLQYSTDSEWNSSPWSTVSYRKPSRSSKSRPAPNPDTSLAATKRMAIRDDSDKGTTDTKDTPDANLRSQMDAPENLLALQTPPD